MTRSYLLPNKLHKSEFRTPKDLYTADPSTQTKESGARIKASLTQPHQASENIATYLNKRLVEIGVKHVITIPGDYIAEWVATLDTDQNEGLVRVHPNNEMCATYAADGYGRATGGQRVGCVAFTYAVGSLNALQAVAGAFVEDVPLVVINGSPSQTQFNSQRDQGVLWHHMFDGSQTDQRIFEQVTRMAVKIDNPAYATDLIDAALIACITDSKPVYIEIASTLECYPVQPVSERQPLAKIPVPQSQSSLFEAVAAILPILATAKKLVVLGGVEIARFSLQKNFTQLLNKLQAPFLSSTLGKGILSEFSAPFFSGTYNGKNSQQNVQDLVNGADVILSLGVHETDFNFAGLTATDFDPNNPPCLPLETTIELALGAATIPTSLSSSNLGEMYWGDIRLGPAIDVLNEVISNPSGNTMNTLVSKYSHLADVQQQLIKAGNKLPAAPFPEMAGEIWDIPSTDHYADDEQITWDSFKSYLHHNYLDTFNEEDAPVVLADTGLSFYNLNNIRVPENGYIAQIAWGAIGYSPAASYGVKLALNDTGQGQRRVLSFSGDGAFSQSVNALGTIGELGLDNVIFVMANGVYAVEQFLIDADAFCKDDGSSDKSAPKFSALCQVPQTALWDWKAIARGFGGVGYEVTTNQELAEVLTKLKQGSPPPATPAGPDVQDNSDTCCEFSTQHTSDRRSTFTLIAVHNVCKDLPSNVKWKTSC